MEQHIYLLLKVAVSTNLQSTYNATKELIAGTTYQIPSTENVKVLKSEIIPLKTNTK